MAIALSGSLWAISRGGWRRWLGCGAVLYLLYVTRIGGDFMAGRFYAPMVTVSALFVAEALAGVAIRRLALGVLLFAQLSIPGLPLSLGTDRTSNYVWTWNEQDQIADEKAYYFRYSGLRNVVSGTGFDTGRELLDRDDLIVNPSMGRLGYASADRRIVVDPMALTDPLLARLPALPNARIGHFLRDLQPATSKRFGAAAIRSMVPAWPLSTMSSRWSFGGRCSRQNAGEQSGTSTP